MAFRSSTASRNAACTAFTTLVDAGSGNGTLKIYTGAQPANVSDEPSGTLLATLTFSKPSFGAPATGMITANAITSETNAPNSGTAGHFVIADSAGNVVGDGVVGQGSGDLSLTSTTITAGQTVAVSSFTVTDPIS